MALQNVKRRLRRKKKPVLAGVDVWFGPTAEDLPQKPVASFDSNLFASYTGPDCGLRLVHQLELDKQAAEAAELSSPEDDSHDSVGNSREKSFLTCDTLLAGTERWNMKNRKAYGICMSLYDQHPVNGKISGDPIADSFGLCARYNNALLVVADGVNWGEKPKLAARCAVYGCIQHVNSQLFGGCSKASLSTTGDVFKLLMNSLNAAQTMILRHDGGLTTLCIALVCPLRDTPNQFVVCVVNVGDSLAFVFSKRHGIREITTGSHDIRSERDIRDAGGALGPARGSDPELHNLTCSMTCIDAGDVVFLTSDGISDNFDPVVTKIAVAKHSKREKGATARYKPSDRKKEPAAELNDNTSTVKDTDEKQVKENPSVVGSVPKTESSEATDCDKPSDAIANDVEESKTCLTEETTDKSILPTDRNADTSLDSKAITSSAEAAVTATTTTAVTATTTTAVTDATNGSNVCEAVDQTKDGGEAVSHVNDASTSESKQKLVAGEENTVGSSENSNTDAVDSEEKPEARSRDSKEPSTDQSLGNFADKSLDQDTHVVVQEEEEEESDEEVSPNEQMDGKPVMSPHERHRYAVKEMERVIHEFELFTELSCSAQELCGALLQHVLKLTDPKRKVLENPRLYGRRLKAEAREKRDSEIVARLSRSAGKLDHATIIGYEAGYWKGNEDENYIDDDDDDDDERDGDFPEEESEEDDGDEEMKTGGATGGLAS